eukprot:IDg16255t1
MCAHASRDCLSAFRWRTTRTCRCSVSLFLKDAEYSQTAWHGSPSASLADSELVHRHRDGRVDKLGDYFYFESNGEQCESARDDKHTVRWARSNVTNRNSRRAQPLDGPLLPVCINGAHVAAANGTAAQESRPFQRAQAALLL